jgi:hypothetical protein
MDGLALLQQARAAGLAVRAEGDRLCVRGPRRAEALVRLLLDHKAEVLAALAPAAPVTVTPAELPPDWYISWDERAAIMEYDGKLPRDRAEALALEDILAQMRPEGSCPGNHACVEQK